MLYVEIIQVEERVLFSRKELLEVLVAVATQFPLEVLPFLSLARGGCMKDLVVISLEDALLLTGMVLFVGVEESLKNMVMDRTVRC